MTVFHYAGVLLVLTLIAGIGIYSGKKVKNAADFSTGGGKAGAWIVAGTIMGTLVSGQATIGTAQLAFTYGMSAWWFTLGAGIGCLILAVGYAVPLRRSEQTTLLSIISKEYGNQAGAIGSVLCSVGIFVSVISQMLSSTALLTTILPINTFTALLIAVILMAVYVIFGGVWGAGMGGVVKLTLMYVASIFSAVLVIWMVGGLQELVRCVTQTLTNSALTDIVGLHSSADVSSRYFNLLARGPVKDIGSGLSLLLGVLSTQTYAQAIWAAKSDSAARKGALLSAFLIPPIGIACILIGLHMRGHYITSAEIEALTVAGQAVPAGLIEIASTSQVFPTFILNYMPKLLGGIVLGTLLITVIGGGSGLSLCVATIIVNDVFCKVSKAVQKPKWRLCLTRGVIVVVLLLAAMVAGIVPGAVINDFGFLSMGLRAAVVVVPVTFALFLRGQVNPKDATAAILAGPTCVLLSKFFLPAAIEPMYPGIMMAFLLMLAGVISHRRQANAISNTNCTRFRL